MGGRVIPLLGKLKLMGGVNRVRQITEVIDGKRVERTLAKEAIAHSEEQGWITIPLDVDGPGTSYLQRPKTAPQVVISRFERVYPGSAVIDCDEEPYVEWCRSLIDRGIIPPPPMYVLEGLRASVAKDLGEAANKLPAVPSLAPLVDRLTADLEAIDAEIAGRKASAAPAEVEELGVADLVEDLGEEEELEAPPREKASPASRKEARP